MRQQKRRFKLNQLGSSSCKLHAHHLSFEVGEVPPLSSSAPLCTLHCKVFPPVGTLSIRRRAGIGVDCLKMAF